MNKLGRYALIVPLVTLLFTASCARKEPPKQQKKAQETAPQATSDPVAHKVLSFNLEGLNEKGSKKWDVRGETAEAISENEIRLDNIVAKAYGEEAEAVITADQGVYDRAKNNVRLEKNVKATIESTPNFTGSFIDVGTAPKDKSSKSDGKSKKTKTVITCDGEVQFDYEKNQAYFLQNVKVVSEDGDIDADKITVYLDPDTRQLKEIVAEGNVKITRGENITYSDKASYSEKEKKITLSGKPKLVIYQEGGTGFGADFLGEGKR
ncbi:MAG: LPS export ABC transporter periplasmic protein LptC [Candidatus Omnitrophica bacterium]|nr:LPS export ABC transporter periplasmic protein LptC [Candidatus Omnitrophota bacterium]MCM8790543.1 LPS export ABC transporter periplasmic protein LptC [Candidatus Omnitrophota bacterium]